MPLALLCLTTAIYYEAANEPLVGKIAVAEVIEHRIKDVRWPDTACKVTHQLNQFSFYWDGKPEKIKHDEEWIESEVVAKLALQDKLPKVIFDCTDHYHNIHVKPSWVTKMEMKMKIGHHFFYCSNPQDWRLSKN